MYRKLALSIAAATCMVGAMPALAKNDKTPTPSPSPAPTPAPSPPVCKIADIGLSSGSCSGFFAGNLLSGNSNDITAQFNALSAAPISFSWDKNWSIVDGTKVSPGDIKQFNFGKTLYGDTIIGIHFGKANGAGDDGVHTQGGATAFYRFDAGLGGILNLVLKYQGLSSAVIYKTGSFSPPPPPPPTVPEPATWAMMIGGFGLIGVAARRRKRMAVTFA